jgi:hypothetical protein
MSGNGPCGGGYDFASIFFFNPSGRFNLCIQLVIFASSIALAMDSPLMNPESNGRAVLDDLDIFFNWYFLFEFVVKVMTQISVSHLIALNPIASPPTCTLSLKVVTFGLWFMPRAYLRDGFNALESVRHKHSLPGFGCRDKIPLPTPLLFSSSRTKR